MSAQHIMRILAAVCFLSAKESLAGTQLIVNEQAVAAPDSPTALEPSEAQEPARIFTRNDNEFVRDSTVSLNRFTFDGNVLRGMGAPTSNWVVFFSTGWDEKCQQLLPSYRAIGTKMSAELNVGKLMSTAVRFAVVDCGTDKELCNSQLIDRYPTVVHYRGGQRLSQWSGGSPGLLPFLKHGLKGTPLPGQGRKRSKQRPGSVVRRVGEDASAPGLPIAEASQTPLDAEFEATPSCCRLAGIPCSMIPWKSFQATLPEPSHFCRILISFLMGIALIPWLFPGIRILRGTRMTPVGGRPRAVGTGINGAQQYMPAEWAHERRTIVL